MYVYNNSAVLIGSYTCKSVIGSEYFRIIYTCDAGFVLQQYKE